MKLTKIIATLGPASSSEEMIRALIEAGVDLFRVNFSHGTREAHGEVIRRVRATASSMEKWTGIIADISGPKIRCGKIEGEPWALAQGDRLTLCHPSEGGKRPRLPFFHVEFFENLKPGHRIFLDDGKMLLRVLRAGGREAEAEVVQGGPLTSNKGMSFPDSALSIGAITEKDREDIRFAAGLDVDYFAVSFIRSGGDLQEARGLVEAAGRNIPLIAKIEKHEALDELPAIVAAADAVMVARGDLGVEMPIEEVPVIQKRIIHACNEAGKPVITATQMMESMIEEPRPTRAEVTDIANAIFDGTDAVMLSGETAVGRHPLEVVATMGRIAAATEKNLDPGHRLRRRRDLNHPFTDQEAIAHAAAMMAYDLKASAILCRSSHGTTPQKIATYRPRCPILAVSPYGEVLRRLSLCFGIVPVHLPGEKKETADLAALVAPAVQKSKILKSGDKIIGCSGISYLSPGSANRLRIMMVP